MKKEIDITNKKFGRWTAIKFSHKDKNGQHFWLCKCECGTVKTVNKISLLQGKTLSCGCYSKEINIIRSTKHNLSHTRIYRIYMAIKARCYNEKVLCFKHYGGRGITICDEWKNDFVKFYDWSMNNGHNDTLTIDRINVNGNYEPNNCRWISLQEQFKNRRSNRKYFYKNEEHTISEWSKIKNINYFTLRSRLDRGWDIGKSLETK